MVVRRVTEVVLLKEEIASARVAGRLAARRPRWLSNGVRLPRVVHQMLSNRTPLLWNDNKPKPCVARRVTHPAHIRIVLDKEVRKQVAEGAVEESSDVVVTSPIFVVPKKEPGAYRVIIDLRYINKFQERKRFRQEGLDVVARLVRKKDWMASIDLKSGFNHAVMDPESRRYLGFFHAGRTYRYRVLPFGSSSSPWIFCRMVRPMVQLARERGIRLVAYVDDILVMAQTEEECRRHTAEVRRIFEEHGWVLNLAKCELEPTRRIEYLGLIVNTEDSPRFEAPARKKRAIRKEARRVLVHHNGVTSRRELARLIGMAMSLARAIGCTRVLTRSLMDDLKRAAHWNEMIVLSESAKRDLEEWLTIMDEWEGSAVVAPPISTVLTTDASHFGWGAVLGQEAAAGQWEDKGRHINTLELMAVENALRHFEGQLEGESILLRSDNTVTVSYVNRLTGRIPELAEVARRIWRLMDKHGGHIRAVYLPGVDNDQADFLSRLNARHEWTVPKEEVHKIEERWGVHAVDLFATRENRRCPAFVARFPDPEAAGVDAFTLDWDRLTPGRLWIAPPVRLMDKVVAALQRCTAVQATVVCPRWTAQPWFGPLEAMATDQQPLKIEIPGTEAARWSMCAFSVNRGR
eukprot:TRINITY_DN398_c0_g1_i1.p2 TRINITY_DN398_c0_g1~~TRINITY_DN398_c0_g1_i1.p2  ORF type:complete len:633 (-),score=104.69 TRINITY_DN398_c0_g1_i1:559-2457(-)